MPFQYSPSTQRYIDTASGRFVKNQAINDAVDGVINSAAEHMTALTQQLQSGAITLAEWQTSMAAEMKPLLVGAAAIGRGGWAQMTQSDWGWTGQRLRAQYAYLRNFAHDIATGQQPMDGRLLNRVKMYPEAARAMQREMQRRTAMLYGRTEEKNQLGAADKHCGSCLACTAQGWVPINTLPAIGSRTCLSRCQCTIITRTQAEAMAA